MTRVTRKACAGSQCTPEVVVLPVPAASRQGYLTEETVATPGCAALNAAPVTPT
jgi:hypothetical protein